METWKTGVKVDMIMMGMMLFLLERFLRKWRTKLLTFILKFVSNFYLVKKQETILYNLEISD